MHLKDRNFNSGTLHFTQIHMKYAIVNRRGKAWWLTILYRGRYIVKFCGRRKYHLEKDLNILK